MNEVFSARGIQFAFGPSFSWPILNYGQITNNVRVQDARLQTLLIDYQNTVLKAQQEVENGLASFLQGRRQVELLRRSVAAANSALRIATRSVSAGNARFHHRADGGAEPLPGAEQPGDRRGQPVHGPCIGLPGARRRMADTRGAMNS